MRPREGDPSATDDCSRGDSKESGHAVSASREELIALLLLTAVASWLAMQAVHESGHIVAAMATGGRVRGLVLHPLAISRTDVEPNPHPLIVVWSGPLFGGLAPALLWTTLRRRGALRWTWLCQTFAGFCLVANGAYLATALGKPVGDSLDLTRLGASTLLVGGSRRGITRDGICDLARTGAAVRSATARQPRRSLADSSTGGRRRGRCGHGSQPLVANLMWRRRITRGCVRQPVGPRQRRRRLPRRRGERGRPAACVSRQTASNARTRLVPPRTRPSPRR